MQKVTVMCEKEEIARLREMVKLYRFDYVTGLKMRVDFEHDGRAKFAEGFYLATHDINGLKQMNDTHGHPAGDSLLRQVANDLRMCPTMCTVYRVGGDEFMTIHCATESITDEDIFIANTSSALIHTRDYDSLDEAVSAVDKLMMSRKRELKRRGEDAKS